MFELLILDKWGSQWRSIFLPVPEIKLKYSKKTQENMKLDLNLAKRVIHFEKFQHIVTVLGIKISITRNNRG